jgi:hypothetical protein
MGNTNSFQVTNETPIASHGLGVAVHCAHFVVTMPITANLDTVAFGFLPAFAVPVNAMAIQNAAHANIDIGITGDGDGFFDGVALVANVPLRSALSTLIGKNVGAAPVAVTGLSNGTGAAGELHLFIDYVIEDTGVAYKYTAAV